MHSCAMNRPTARFVQATRGFWGWHGNPHSLRAFAGPMADLHRLARRHALVARFGRFAWLPTSFLTLAWPLRLAFQARRWVGRFGEMVRARYGVAHWRQMFDIARLGLEFGIPPQDYYQLRLFLPANRGRLESYLFHHEIGPLFGILNGPRHDPAVADKRLFGERCAMAGLASVPLAAWWENGRIQWVQSHWCDGDLVSKPATGARGEGVRFWRSLGDGRYEGGGEIVSRSQLLAHLARESAGRPWLLQAALHNHDQIADLSAGALVTVRIMTALSPSGACEAFAALLKIPIGPRYANNSGLGSAIDLRYGTLGPAHSYGPVYMGIARHPETGAAITGRRLPDWEHVLAMVTRAHALFPAVKLLGWDVALTLGGPVLLETNSGWDVNMPQIVAGPLGETRFVRLCSHLIEETHA